MREPCARIIGAAAGGALRATTTVEVIQEFAHVHARRRDRALVARTARDYADLLAPLIIVEARDLESGLELWLEAAELGAFDAVLAAAARDRGADALVSADSAFSGIPGLRHVDPSGSDLDELLGS